MDKNRENRHELSTPRRKDEYDYCDFPAMNNPEGVMIARQIQAQSYLNNQFVTPEGLVVLETGQQVLAHDIADPSEIPSVLSNWTE